MKYLNKLLLLLTILGWNISFAQTVNTQFSLAATANSVTTTTVTLTFIQGGMKPDDGGTYLLSDITAGDVFFTTANSKYTVVSRSGNVVTYTDLTGLAAPILNGTKLGFVREVTINGYKVAGYLQNGDGNGGAITGIPSDMAAAINNHYEVNRRLAITASSISLNSLDSTFLKNKSISANNLSQQAIDSILSLSTGKIKVGNGITKTGDSLTLGGTLTKPTTITTTTNPLNLITPTLLPTNGYLGDKWLLSLDGNEVKRTTVYQFVERGDTTRNGIYTGKVATQFYVDSTTQKKYLGTIYNKNSWTSTDLTNDFTNIGTDASIVSNKIQITNGSNTYTNVLSIKDTSALEHWKFVAKIKINAINSTSYGFGIGARGINAHPTSVMTRIGFTGGANDGKLYLDYGSSSGYTNILNTKNKVAASVNDYIVLQLERDFFTVHATIWNATTNATLVDTSYTYTTTQVNPYMSNTCTYPIYSLGGSFTIDSISLTSTEMVGADLALVGNSKVQGFNASRPQKRFASLLSQQYSVVALGSGYDYSSDIKNRIAEIISLKPKNVILCDITSNDQRVNGLTDSTNYYANVLYINNALTAAGITTYISLPMYETTIDQSKTTAWMQRTFPSSKLIDLWSPLKPFGMLDSDGTHTTDLGHKQVASVISNLNIINNGNHAQDNIDIPTAQTLGLGTKAYNNQFDYTAGTSTNANNLSNSGQTTIGYAFTNASNSSAWHAITTLKSDTFYKQMVQYDDAFYSNAPRLARRTSGDGGATWGAWQTFAFIDQLGDRALTNNIKGGGSTAFNIDTLIHTTGQIAAGYNWTGTTPQAGGRHFVSVLRDMSDSAQVVQYADGTYSAYRQARRISNNNGTTWGAWQKYVFQDQLSSFAYLDPYINNASTAVNIDTLTHTTGRVSFGSNFTGTTPNVGGRNIVTVLRSPTDSAYVVQYSDGVYSGKRLSRRLSQDNGATWGAWTEVIFRDTLDANYTPYTGATKNLNLGNNNLFASKLGLGTTSPTYKLDIVGSDPVRLIGLNAGTTTDSVLTSNAGVVRRLLITDVSNTSVTTAAPQGSLTVGASPTTTIIIPITNSVTPNTATNVNRIQLWYQPLGSGNKFLLVPTIDFSLSSIVGNNVTLTVGSTPSTTDKFFIVIK